MKLLDKKTMGNLSFTDFDIEKIEFSFEEKKVKFLLREFDYIYDRSILIWVTSEYHRRSHRVWYT